MYLHNADCKGVAAWATDERGRGRKDVMGMGAAPSDYRDEIRGQPAIDSLDKCIKKHRNQSSALILKD